MRNFLITYFSHCLNKSSSHFREMPKSTLKVPDTTQRTNATQIHPTVNNFRHNSDNQGLSVTWIVIICIGGLVSFMAFMVFAWCMLKKKKKKVLPAAPLLLQSSLPAIIMWLFNTFLWLLQQRKRISDDFSEICAVVFGLDCDEPMRVVAVRTSHTSVSECTRLLL